MLSMIFEIHQQVCYLTITQKIASKQRNPKKYLAIQDPKKMHVTIQAETNAKDKKRLILRNEDEISS